MAITRINARVDGFAGGPAINSWYFRRDDGTPMVTGDVNAALADVRAFYAAIAANYSTSEGIQVLSPGTTLDESNGALLGATGTAVPALVSGTTAIGVGPAQVAILAQLNTGVVANGRILKGRVFLGPFQLNVPAAGAVPAPATLSGMATAMATLLAAQTSTKRLCVWHRPRPASDKFPVARAGSALNVAGVTFPSRWVTQRRRLI
jgi:hypothetical protein